MSGEKFLVDTNVIIRFFKGETELFNLFDNLENIFVSSVSVGELMYGAELSARSDFNRENYFCFCESLNVIVPDLEISKMYGKIKKQLKYGRHPIPENDIWIAATAAAVNLTLITADSDFETISGLRIVKR